MKKINFNDKNITADEILENVEELMKREDSDATIIDYLASYIESKKIDENVSILKAELCLKVEKIAELETEIKNLFQENEKLQEELKKKNEKRKILEKHTQPKPKGMPRGGRKAKKDKEDVNIDDVLKEGLGE